MDTNRNDDWMEKIVDHNHTREVPVPPLIVFTVMDIYRESIGKDRHKKEKQRP